MLLLNLQTLLCAPSEVVNAGAGEGVMSSIAA